VYFQSLRRGHQQKQKQKRTCKYVFRACGVVISRD